MHPDFEEKIVGKVKLICIICTLSTQPVQIYLLTQNAFRSEFILFTSLMLLYKTLDLLTYLATTFYLVHSGVMQICCGELTRCLFIEKYY